MDNEVLSSANVLGGYQNVVGSYRGEDYYTYSKDVQGSTSSITDGNFTAKAIYEYSDFGEVKKVVESIDNEICYTGAIHDETTGLHYMNARYYDPANGRFISQDSYRGSVNVPEQWHLYVYCANNPINYTDPSGHLRKHWWNSVTWVGRFIDAAIFVIGGWKIYASRKTMLKFIRESGERVNRRIKAKLERELQANISGFLISSAIELAFIFAGSSIGTIIAKSIDYVEGWWGYKRNNGYILN